MPHALPDRPNLSQLKKQAKDLLKAHRAGDPAVAATLQRLGRFAAARPPEILAAEVTLNDVQHALACEHGFGSWARLKRHVEGLESRARSQLKREGGAAWITEVPKLGWGLDRDGTFVGSLEAALAATQDPWAYADLMGFSGLAFRIRWSLGLCPSCAVGEMPDEGDGIAACTGWALPVEIQFGQESPDREPIRQRIVQSIDAGLPVLVYGICLDMAVAYGYEDSGRTLWLTDYHAQGAMPYKLPLDKLGPMQFYLSKERPAISPAEQLRRSISLGVRNWGIGKYDDRIPDRDYVYGPLAYDAWLDALRGAGALPEDRLHQLFHTHFFVWVTLADARKAAARFLNGRMEQVSGEAKGALGRAAGVCSEQVRHGREARANKGFFASPYEGGKLETWPDRREGEIEVVEWMKQQDAQLHAELQRALKAMA